MKKILLTLALALGFTSVQAQMQFDSRDVPHRLSFDAQVGGNGTMLTARLENEWGMYVEGGWMSLDAYSFNPLKGNQFVNGFVGLSTTDDYGPLELSLGLGGVADLHQSFDFSKPQLAAKGSMVYTIYEGGAFKFQGVMSGLLTADLTRLSSNDAIQTSDALIGFRTSIRLNPKSKWEIDRAREMLLNF